MKGSIILFITLWALTADAISKRHRSRRSVFSQSTVVQYVTTSTTITITSAFGTTGNCLCAATTSPILNTPLPTSTLTASVSVLTISAVSGTVQSLPPLSTQTPNTVGTINTALSTTGSAAIISTSITTPASIIQPTGPISSIQTTIVASMTSDNIFQPIATDAPPSVLPTRPDHPVPRLDINQKYPIETNKFYANFFLGSQTAPTWTHPYSLAWSKGGGSSGSWGMTIMHIDDNQKAFGPLDSVGAASYFTNPGGIQSLVLSEASLGASTTLSMDGITDMSINVRFLSSAGSAPVMNFPLVQGMGFVTAEFSGGTPIIQTGVYFSTLTKTSYSAKYGVTKYSILLEDGKTWLLYATSPTGQILDLTVVNHALIQASSGFSGTVQIAKSPSAAAEALYDVACGAYAKGTTVSGSVQDTLGSYNLSFTKAGMTDTTLLMFALPHHVKSFSPPTALNVYNSVQLTTTTKGQATAVLADSWTLQENLPTTMEFAPWRPAAGSYLTTLSAATLAIIEPIAALEVSQNMSQQSNLNSMYYSGKALAKFATIVYTINDLLGNQTLAQAGLENLKQAFALFTTNQQQFPLVYETAWGGIVSSASYITGNPGADFGNTYYNDHHFHYGYFIYAASIIAYLDPTWLTVSPNKAWVSSLVRDIANPSPLDPYFPISRCFDWYHGHSWAHGLFETFDGKDEESSSEDANSAYAIKLWGHVTGDANMEARGNLQLAVTARSLQNYFLYESENAVEPKQFVGNKVSGILFENKIDHTTYFGDRPEYVQGIHMLPLLPFSTLTRTLQFVAEEWTTWFANGVADAVVGGWKGILFANLAITDPVTSWNFFASPTFDASWLDGGASRTWYLAWAAGLGGGPA